MSKQRLECKMKRQRRHCQSGKSPLDQSPGQSTSKEGSESPPWSSIQSPWPPATPQLAEPAHQPACATVTVEALEGHKASLKMLEEIKFRLSCKVCYEPFSDVLGVGGLDHDIFMKTPVMPAWANPTPVLLSCGHVFCCDCVNQAANCPCCRAPIVGKHRVFFP
jgi:hypothetical protein